CDGAIVLERDDHHFAEASGLYDDSGCAELRDENLEYLPRPPRLLGIVEARAASARDRSRERELRDCQNRSARFGNIAIHLAGIIAEDAQLADFARRVAHRLLAVAFLHGCKNEHSDADFGDDLAADRYRRATDALNDALHNPEDMRR